MSGILKKSRDISTLFCLFQAVFTESFRDETGRPRQRTISTLGRLDEPGGPVCTG